MLLNSNNGTKQYENLESIEGPIWEISETAPPPSPTMPEHLESKVPALLRPQPMGILGNETEEPKKRV